MLRVKFAQDPDPTIMLDDFAGAVDLKRFKDNVGEVRDVLSLVTMIIFFCIRCINHK